MYPCILLTLVLSFTAGGVDPYPHVEENRMSAKLATLKLFLNELGIDSNINTVDDRKRVQKAVYLGQIARVDLGIVLAGISVGPTVRG
jgi:hypothetical protein